MGETIEFYRTTGPHGFLSNFYQAPLYLQTAHGGSTLVWHSEAIYQALKCCPHQPRRALEILRAKSPMKAAEMGRDKERTRMHPRWDEVRDDAMRYALARKFASPLWRKLEATGDAILIEKSARDPYWGCGVDGSGKNRLGRLLMELRNRIRGHILFARDADVDTEVINGLQSLAFVGTRPFLGPGGELF